MSKCDTCTAEKTLAKCEDCEANGYTAYERGAVTLRKSESIVEKLDRDAKSLDWNQSDFYRELHELKKKYGVRLVKEWEPESPSAKPDAVNHPQHYTQGGIECIDAIRAALTKGTAQQVQDESITDTLLDLANYAIMTVIEMRRGK